MNRIRTLREAAGMTQDELAVRLGVKGGAAVSKYEIGYTSLPEHTLRMLSLIFDASVDYILGLSDEKNVKGRGTSFSRPQMSWDALAMIDSADALSDDDRKIIFTVLRTPRLIDVMRSYMSLSSSSQRKVVDFIEMSKIYDDFKKGDNSDNEQ